MVAPSTTPATARSGRSPSIFGEIAGLGRDASEHLLVLLQEKLDGGPFVGELPEVPGGQPGDMADAWKTELARRLADMVEGRVEVIDAQGSAARLVQRAEKRFSPCDI